MFGRTDRSSERPLRPGIVVAYLAFLLLCAGAAAGEEALVAVAANFTEVMEQLEEDFESASAHELNVVVGSTGKLYAQIGHGAPFDVFLAADQRRPKLLEEEGLAVAGSRFTYAAGRLTLWSPEPDRIGDDGAATLREGAFRLLAIANPDLAPYGAAARQTLESLGLRASLEDKIVMGETIGQAHALVASGNVELGFVALSYVLSPRNKTPGSRWDVPARLHSPILQDAVLVSRAAGNPAARGFLDFLKSEEAKAVIESFGYGVE